MSFRPAFRSRLTILPVSQKFPPAYPAVIVVVADSADFFRRDQYAPQGGISQMSRQTSTRQTRILQIAYSPVLLFTRHLILISHGYSVLSVLGNDRAIGAAAKRNEEFDVVLIGHCTEISERREAARFARESFPQARVVALRSATSGGEVYEADLNTDSENPDDWLYVVRSMAA